jgi:ATPase subunit of ABC transporter with duplicated ATPase domains
MKNSLAGISKELGVTGKKKGNSNATGSNSKSNPVSATTKAPTGPSLTVLKTLNVKADKAIERINMETFSSLETNEEKEMMISEMLSFSDEKKKIYNVNSLSYITEVCGLLSHYGLMILNTLLVTITQPSPMTTSAVMECYLLLLQALLKVHKHGLEPFLFIMFPYLVNMHSDRLASIRDLCTDILTESMNIFSPESFRLLFPTIIQNTSHEDWKIRVCVLNCLKLLAPRMSKQLSPLLPIIIPRVSECVIDSKKQVQVAGIESLTIACQSITNDDIRPLVPKLVSVIARPEESEATLNNLLETTFVVNVDSAVLALLSPLLLKVLRGRSSPLKRKACRVIDIMCRLVQNPADAAPFIPMLLPALDRAIDELTDQEIVAVAKAAREVLVKAVGAERIAKIMANKGLLMEVGNISASSSHTKLSGLDTSASMDVSIPSTDITDAESTNEEAGPTGAVNQAHEYDSVRGNMYQALIDTISKHLEVTAYQSDVHIVCDYVSQLCANLIVYDSDQNPNIPPTSSATDLWRYSLAMSKPVEWKACTEPYLTLLLPTTQPIYPATTQEEEGEAEASDPVTQSAASAIDIHELTHHFRSIALKDVPDAQFDEEDVDGGNLCNFTFSLAFGGKILLQNSVLRLGKGRRYGIMGKNGAGKTTLLTNIGTGNIEGLPTSLRTVYLQHDDATDDHGLSIIDELLARTDLIEVGVTREAAVEALMKIGFTEQMIASPRSLLSGGWKMKLIIVRAMLSQANVYLMDEPTNHLDKASVQWLIQTIKSLPEATCMIVSHDTAFLDAVITDVIHYENKKLVYYHGNLTHFVKIHPEAKFYYELSGSTMTFKFPTPERLDGINSTTRAILKAENVSYTYPGASKPQLTDVNVKVCLGSRIAVTGLNGAGKSTLIKILVQETEPDKDGIGEVWKHMNLRVAYVAQHSFHHIEQHLDVSPVDYIKWRFSGGVDKEEFQKPVMNTAAEEEMKSSLPKRYGDVDQVLGRRKNGRTMEYECTFHGQTARDPNKYIPLEQMIEMGHSKLVQQMDARVAAMAAGLDMRPLLIAEIQGHLDDFNLEAEFGTHGTIRRLSGGQKVKLVLAAAMWNRPHVLVLDEPTNYLDREALGALTQAIKDFAGGVVIISHHSEFTDTLCTEKWLVQDGHVYTEGEILEDSKVKSSNAKKEMKKNASDQNLAAAAKEDASGNLNSTIASEVILNPKTLEGLSKKETRKLERCAAVAGVSLKEYVSKINCKSPEWKWL